MIKKTLNILRSILRWLTSFCRRINFWMYLALMVTMTSMAFVFGRCIEEGGDFTSNLAEYSGDAVMLTLPFWFLGRRYKWLTVAMVWMLAVFLTVNNLYFDYWHDTLPFREMFVAANFNSFVFNSVIPLWGASEWFYVLMASAYTCAYVFYFRHHRMKTPPGTRLWLIVASLAFYVVAFLAVNTKAYIWYNKTAGANVSFRWILSTNFRTADCNADYYRGRGVTHYTMAQTVLLFQEPHVSLNDEEKAFVEEVLSEHERRPVFEKADSLADFSINRHKNLIFIVVESLNSNVIGTRVNGLSITPTLDSLLTRDNTLANLDIITQIKDGGSADGQMIYNTGLLPVNQGITANTFGDNSHFPGLPRLLKPAMSAEFICERGTVWNHRATSRAYGYDRLFDADSLEASGLNRQETGNDAAVFAFALSRLKEMPQPFLAFITTLSMHFPFNDAGVKPDPRLNDPSADVVTNNFMRMLHHFDTSLGHFLTGLKQAGLYDGSVIVLASDHDFFINSPDHRKEYDIASPIAFICLNSGAGGRLTAPAGQVDVYPTVLDIMGYEGAGYRGLGYSMVKNRVTGAVGADKRVFGILSEEARTRLTDLWRASDLIIRSDHQLPGR